MGAFLKRGASLIIFHRINLTNYCLDYFLLLVVMREKLLLKLDLQHFQILQALTVDKIPKNPSATYGKDVENGVKS